MAKDLGKNDGTAKQSQKQRRKEFEMDLERNEKEKAKLSRKKMKLSRKEQPRCNNADKEMESSCSRNAEVSPKHLKLKRRKGSAEEDERCAGIESKEKANSESHSSIEINNEGHRENCDLETTSSTKRQNKIDSNATNWVQKASWKSLVGQTGRVSFSLSSILGPNFSSHSNTNTTRGVVHNDDDTNNELMMTNKLSSNNVSSWIDGYSSTPSSAIQCRKAVITLEDGTRAQADASEPLKHQHHKSVKEMQAKGETGELAQPTVEIQKGTEQPTQQTHLSLLLMVTSAKTCPFMRSDTSEQEWLESKKAVKEIFKRSHKDALRNMKILHTKQKY